MTFANVVVYGEKIAMSQDNARQVLIRELKETLRRLESESSINHSEMLSLLNQVISNLKNLQPGYSKIVDLVEFRNDLSVMISDSSQLDLAVQFQIDNLRSQILSQLVLFLQQYAT